MTGRTPSRFHHGDKKPTLEDYILDMGSRPPEIMMDGTGDRRSGGGGGNVTVTDQGLWEQLQKKEEDLLLAAELGKALLEKNEELTKQHERTVEEYSTKLEVSCSAGEVCVRHYNNIHTRISLTHIRRICLLCIACALRMLAYTHFQWIFRVYVFGLNENA